MSVSIEGEGEIACSLDSVAQAIDNHIGEYFSGVVSLMPGLTSVGLVEQHPAAVIITTNEEGRSTPTEGAGWLPATIPPA